MATVRMVLLSFILIHVQLVKNGARGERAVPDNNINGYDGLYNSPDHVITGGQGITSMSEILATAPDMVTKSGYPMELHTVTTEDGYVLTVQRILGSPKAAPSDTKPPVLVMHGVTACSDTFLVVGPDLGLGFVLADQGYDVWLGNARGNFYSRKHVTLSPKDPKFWEFTWHEIGAFDLPATIDHILATTNQKQLFYVGHSMGTTVFFVLASVRPEYNRMIRLSVNMAPAVFLNNFRSELLMTVATNIQPIYRLARAAGIYEIFPRRENAQLLLGQACKKGNPLLEVCLFGLQTAFGLNRESFDTTKSPIIFSHLVAGGSLNTAVHFAQNLVADRFQMFDPTVSFGKHTQEYNLSLVTAPVYLIYAENDMLIHPDAVMRLNRSLPNVVGIHRLPDENASHVDFVFSKNQKRVIYEDMIREMNRYR